VSSGHLGAIGLDLTLALISRTCAAEALPSVIGGPGSDFICDGGVGQPWLSVAQRLSAEAGARAV